MARLKCYRIFSRAISLAKLVDVVAEIKAIRGRTEILSSLGECVVISKRSRCHPERTRGILDFSLRSK
jgi:hypothetical protein